MENMIEIKNLYKQFGDIQAVNNLSFKVKKGELFAFLGVNGAGKSTTINIICGQLKKDKGEILITGKSLDENPTFFKNILGVVFQTSVLDKDLTVYDNLQSRASLYGIIGKDFQNQLNKLSEILSFKDLLKRPLGKLSGGQKRRIDIARALIHNPKILILDEPTTELDPQTRTLLWDVINNLRKEEGLTVFLTTHYMEEAADADYVVIINHGQIAAEGTPLDLKNKYTGDFLTLYNVNEEEIKQLNLKYTKIHNGFKIEIPNTSFATKLIYNYPELFQDYEIIKGKMDDVFLQVTGQNLTGEKK